MFYANKKECALNATLQDIAVFTKAEMPNVVSANAKGTFANVMQHELEQRTKMTTMLFLSALHGDQEIPHLCGISW